MAIRINNKEYLNYEEQVLKNKKDIEELEKVIDGSLSSGFKECSYEVYMGACDKRISQIPNIGYRARAFRIDFSFLFHFTQYDTLRIRVQTPSGVDHLEGELEINNTDRYTIYFVDAGGYENNLPTDFKMYRNGELVLDIAGAIFLSFQDSNVHGIKVSRLELFSI